MRHGLAALVLVIALATPARADLIDLGNGMIYDTVQDLTWVQDAMHRTGRPDSTRMDSWSGPKP